MRVSILVFFLLGVSIGSADNKVDFTVDYVLGDYYYPYVDQRHKNKGCLTDFVTKVFASQGVKLGEIRWLPWSVAMKSLNYGTTPSVSFPWSYTKERAQNYLYSDVLYRKPVYIWTRASEKEKYSNFMQLNGAKICLPQGYGAYDALKEMFDQKKALRVTALTMQDCFSQLKDKRVEAVYAGDDAIKNMTCIKNWENLFVKAFIAGEKIHYLIAGKDQISSSWLISLFNAGLKTMKFDPDVYCSF